VLLVVVGVIAFSVGSGGGQNSAVKLATQTPAEGQDQVAAGEGVTGTANATVNVRNGPGNTTQALGVLRRGGQVTVDGKSEDGEWLEIVYPPRSKLHGWVMASSLDLQGDAASLAVATPEEIPLAVAPTSVAVATAEETTPTPELTVTVTTTALPTLPDLVVSNWLVSGGYLVVTVTNQGTGTLTATAIDVGVFDASGAKLLNSTSAAPQTLKPGASIDIKTGYLTLGAPGQVLVIVDPNGKIPETNDTNNRLVVTFSGGTPTATATVAATATASLH
jgi:uncharacterized protein YraI